MRVCVVAAWICAAAAAACGGATTEQIVGPGDIRCQIAISAAPAAVPPTASSVTLTVTTARDCTWSATSDAAWAQVTPGSGQGNGSLAIAVAANAQPRSRSASVAVNDASIRIVQEAAPCRFVLQPAAARIGREGGRVSIAVSAIDGCDWSVGGSASWFRVLTANGSGSGTAVILVERNDGAERVATLSVAGLSFVLSQEGDTGSSPPAPPPPAPISCSFAIAPDRMAFRSPGGTGSVRVVTEAGCAWTAAAGPSWLTLSRTSGNGPDTVQYQVAPNLSTTSDRSGTVTVAGHLHSVTQDACPLTVDPAQGSFTSAGGDATFAVRTDAGCTWSAATNAEWISIIRASGAGPDTVAYRVAVNTSYTAARGGTITVSGRSHAVQQDLYHLQEISREGVLSDVTGACPSFTFSVGGTVFVTDGHTRFDTDCGKIRNGVRAFVRGNVLPDGRVLATQVDLDD